MPIAMPLRSMELVHHAARYRILTSTAVAKPPSSSCAGFVMSDPGTFRAFLLVAGIHRARLTGDTSSFEATMLYYKVESMRLVNGMIGDAALATTDMCFNLIVGLALCEAALGDVTVAEAHLKALSSLLEKPEGGHHRLFGLIERLVILATSLVAAAKTDTDDDTSLPLVRSRRQTPRPLYSSKPPGPIFRAVPFVKLRLSPFYSATPPDMEACNADAECQIMTTTLETLSAAPGFPTAQTPSPTRRPRKDVVEPDLGLRNRINETLFADADSYIASLLFKPPPQQIQREAMEENARVADSYFPAMPGLSRTQRQKTNLEEEYRLRLKDPSNYPFARLPPTIFPSTSRSWASAAYLYMHLILHPLLARDRNGTQKIIPLDNYLRRWLIGTLYEDLGRTEEAMMLGAHSSEMWLWKAVVAAYAVKTMARDNDGSDNDSDEDEEGATPLAQFDALTLQNRGPSMLSAFSMDIESLQAWFGDRIKNWSRGAEVTSWVDAKTALRHIAWPDDFYDESEIEELWDKAVRDEDKDD